MKIGLSVPLAHETPQQWAKKHRELGCGSVVFPVNCEASPETIDAYRKAAEQEGLIIAEVGIWKNVLAVDNREREEAVAYSINQLKMADKIGAKCCVNIVGTPHGPIWDGGYPGNFSKETWKMAVDSIQHIIDEANPVNTKFSIEPMPWMIPTGPDEYLRLIGDVDREAFGVHMDLINMVNCPQRYFFAEEFMEECFSKLKGRILSCHIKDVLLLNEFTFQLFSNTDFKKLCTGSAQPQLTNTSIQKIKIFLPNRQLIEKYQRCTIEMSEKQEVLYKEQRALTQARNRLLSKLINGTVEV